MLRQLAQDLASGPGDDHGMALFFQETDGQLAVKGIVLTQENAHGAAPARPRMRAFSRNRCGPPLAAHHPPPAPAGRAPGTAPPVPGGRPAPAGGPTGP